MLKLIRGTLPPLTTPPPWLSELELHHWQHIVSMVTKRRELDPADAPALLAATIARCVFLKNRFAAPDQRQGVNAAFATNLAEAAFIQLDLP